MSTKIKDGLFISDYDCAQDFDFLFPNQITHIINCAGREVRNSFEKAGIKYLTFYWSKGPCELLGNQDINAKKIYMFIEEAFQNCDCCLIHSYDGTNRSAACLAIYFMAKYGWSADDSIKYIKVVRPPCNCSPNFVQQLELFGTRLSYFRTNLPPSKLPDDSDLLLNTYNNVLNSKQQRRISTSRRTSMIRRARQSIKWSPTLIRPATPSYNALSQNISILAVYKMRLQENKLTEPTKSVMKEDMKLNPSIASLSNTPTPRMTPTTSPSTPQSKLSETSTTATTASDAPTPRKFLFDTNVEKVKAMNSATPLSPINVGKLQFSRKELYEAPPPLLTPSAKPINNLRRPFSSSFSSLTTTSSLTSTNSNTNMNSNSNDNSIGHALGGLGSSKSASSLLASVQSPIKPTSSGGLRSSTSASLLSKVKYDKSIEFDDNSRRVSLPSVDKYPHLTSGSSTQYHPRGRSYTPQARDLRAYKYSYPNI